MSRRPALRGPFPGSCVISPVWIGGSQAARTEMLPSWLIGKRWRPLLVLFAVFQGNRLRPSTFWQAEGSSHSFSCSSRCIVKILIPYFDWITLIISISKWKTDTVVGVMVKKIHKDSDIIGLILFKCIFRTDSLKPYHFWDRSNVFTRQSYCFKNFLV